MVFIYSSVDLSESSEVLAESSDLSSLKSSEIAPILPRVADKSAGKKTFVALPSATFSSDSKYLIAIRSFVGSPLCIAAKTFSIASASPSAIAIFSYFCASATSVSYTHLTLPTKA